tara:strand:- start:45 stop:308 length:264 start_codon:yes stop_codon:yes gene_type:complete
LFGITLGQIAHMTLKNYLKSGINQLIRRVKKMSQVKKMRVFKLTDSQLDLMLQSIRRTKRTSYERLNTESQKDFDLMFEEVVEPYNF